MNSFDISRNTETGPSYQFPTKGSAKETRDLTVKYIQDLDERTQRIEAGLAETERKNKEQNNRNIEILAVFVTLFTFISIETQILRSGISLLTAVGFSVIILAGLLIFLFTLRFSLESTWQNFLQYLLLLICGVVMIGVGLFVIWQGQKAYLKDVDERFYTKQQLDNLLKINGLQFNDFKNCIIRGVAVAVCARLVP